MGTSSGKQQSECGTPKKRIQPGRSQNSSTKSSPHKLSTTKLMPEFQPISTPESSPKRRGRPPKSQSSSTKSSPNKFSTTKMLRALQNLTPDENSASRKRDRSLDSRSRSASTRCSPRKPSASNLLCKFQNPITNENSSPKKRGRTRSQSLSIKNSPQKMSTKPTQSQILSFSNESPSPKKRGRLSNSQSSSIRNSPRMISNKSPKHRILSFSDEDFSPKKKDRIFESSDSECSSNTSSPEKSPRKNLFRERQNLDTGPSPKKRGHPLGRRSSSVKRSSRKLLIEPLEKPSLSFSDEENSLPKKRGRPSGSRSASVKSTPNKRFPTDLLQKFQKLSTSWQQNVPSSDYSKFMQSTGEHLFHLGEIEKRLAHDLQKLVNRCEGSALTLYGKQGSGKTTVINRVFKGRDDINFVELNGKFTMMFDIKQKLKAVKELSNEEKPVVFVLYSFDMLFPSFANKVLYNLTNGLQNRSMLLILVSEKQNAFESLEKRIVSRIGQNSMKCIHERLESKECWQLVQKMVERALENCNNNVKRTFKLPTDPPINFERLCSRSPCYAQLKLFIKDLADEVFDSIKNNVKKPLEDIISQILTPIDFTLERLKGLTDRMYGLLISAAISTKHITQNIPIAEVFKGYKRFLNEYQINTKSFLIEEFDFQEDIEYIVYQGFWLARRQNERIISISWIEDPLMLFSDKHHHLFHSSLIFWLNKELTDNSNLH